MPKIPDDIIRRIQDIAKIEDVVKDCGVKLRKAGVNLTGLCPFHDDKIDGNFIVRPSTLSYDRPGRNSYRCFVCDAKGGPVQFLMAHEQLSFPDAIRWLGKKYNEPVDDVPLNYTPPPPRPVPPPPPPLEMPREWVKELMGDYNSNTFTLWYGRLPWSDHQRQTLRHTLWQYCVGCYRDGRVVFWYIDHTGIPRAAKLMKYLPDGHRDKQRNPGWLYNQEGYRDICQPDEHTILKPLFGAHLLKRYTEASVNIVESEKTALIMANYFGDPERQLWMACGGLKFLKLESLQPLIDQGRKVWLWPDKDGVKGWQEVADKLGCDNIKVYTKFFDACWEPEDGDKADIADIAVRLLYHPDWKPRDTGEGSHTPQGGEAKTPCAPLSPTENGATLAHTPDHEQSAEAMPEEWAEHQAVMKAIHDFHLTHAEDEPFFDPIELQDPRVRMWRDILRQAYNFNKRNDNEQ